VFHLLQIYEEGLKRSKGQVKGSHCPRAHRPLEVRGPRLEGSREHAGSFRARRTNKAQWRASSSGLVASRAPGAPYPAPSAAAAQS
jgi:hypothetical protein